MSTVPPHRGPLGMGSGLPAFRKIAGQRIKASDVAGGPIRTPTKSGSIKKTLKQVAATPVRLSAPRPDTKAPKDKDEDDKKLVEVAKKRFQLASDAEAEVRKDALADLKFRAGDQWPSGIKRQRETDGRPCLTINQIPQFIRQVTNDQRQNRPSIQVNPVDDQADPETGEIIQGIIRHIEYDSAADAAYDTAFQAAVTGGFGYFRINTAYSDPTSFEQDIKILRIRNAFTVYFDPNCKEPDYSDANWAFVVETISKDDYKAQYKDSQLANPAMDDWQSIGDSLTDDWVSQDACRVVEYFYRESIDETIVLLSDGTSVIKKYLPETLPEGITVVKERKTQLFAVKWCKLNGVEVLEETDWLGQWIPIVPVLGDELDIDGKRVLEGLVRNAKEPQQQYNFMASASTEAIALSPKAPFIGAEGQFEGRPEWQTANVKNHAYLQYKPVSIAGTPVGPPQRNVVQPEIQSTTMAMMQASQDLKSVTGIYQAALGQQGNETSGKGILARQQQSQGSNFHYVDNLTRALRHAGRIILDLIPKVYDTERVIRIIGADGTQATAKIGPSQEDQQEAAAVERIYDLSVGKYDVTISVGPSYQTKRQEAVNSILSLVSSFPQIMPVAGDILVKNMDWPGAEEIAERLEKMLPPNLQEQDEQGQQLPPEAQQAMAQMHQQNQELTQHLNAAVQDLEHKTSEKKMELESKERIAFAQVDIDRQKLQLDYLKLQTQLVSADIAAKAGSAETAFEHEMELLGVQINNAHEYAMAHVQHEHAQEQQAQQVEGQSQLQDQQTQGQAQLQQQAADNQPQGAQ